MVRSFRYVWLMLATACLFAPPARSLAASPVAVADTIYTETACAIGEDQQVNCVTFGCVNVLANDYDPDNDDLALTAIGASPYSPLLDFADEGGGEVCFGGQVEFYPDFSVTYSISDGHGGTANGTLYVHYS